jgi:hypothetical protein
MLLLLLYLDDVSRSTEVVGGALAKSLRVIGINALRVTHSRENMAWLCLVSMA